MLSISRPRRASHLPTPVRATSPLHRGRASRTESAGQTALFVLIGALLAAAVILSNTMLPNPAERLSELRSAPALSSVEDASGHLVPVRSAR